MMAMMALAFDMMHFAYTHLSKVPVYQMMNDIGMLKLALDTTYAVVKAYTPRLIGLWTLFNPISIDACIRYLGDHEVHGMCQTLHKGTRADMETTYVDAISMDTMVWVVVMVIAMAIRFAVPSCRKAGVRNHLIAAAIMATGWMAMGVVHSGIAHLSLTTGMQYASDTSQRQKAQKSLHHVATAMSGLLSCGLCAWVTRGCSITPDVEQKVNNNRQDIKLLTANLANNEVGLEATQERLRDLEARINKLEPLVNKLEQERGNRSRPN